eukprot:Em0001g1200a
MAGSKEATDRPSYHAVGKEDIVAVDRKTFRSDVWEHYGWHRKAIGSSWVVCNRCCAWVSRKGNNTSNMRHHLKSVHGVVGVTESSIMPNRCDKEVARIGCTTTSTSPATPSPGSSTVRRDKGCSSTGLSAGKGTLERYITQMQPNVLKGEKLTRANELLVKAFTANLLPPKLMDSPEFREFLDYISNGSYEIPHRTKTTLLIDMQYENVLKKIKAMIADAVSVSITTDAASMHTGDSYFAITAHWLDSQWNLMSCMLGVSISNASHTAEEISSIVKGLVNTEFMLENRLDAIASDQGANFVAAIRKLIEEGVSEEQVRCSCHKLQLSIKNSLEVKNCPSASLIERFRTISCNINNSPMLLDALKKSQQGTDLGCLMDESQEDDDGVQSEDESHEDDGVQPEDESDAIVDVPVLPHRRSLKLIKDICTRWNSTFYMLQRCVLLQKHITNVLAESKYAHLVPSADEWLAAEKLCSLLKPFQIATDFLQGEKYPTLGGVSRYITTLVDGLQGTTPPVHWQLGTRWNNLPKVVQEVRGFILQDMRRRWDPTDLLFGMGAITHPGHKSLSWLNRSNRQTIFSQLRTEMMNVVQKDEADEDDSDDEDDHEPPAKKAAVTSAEEDFDLLFGHKDQSPREEIAVGDEDHIEDEYQSYLKEAEINFRKDDPMEWWRKHEVHFPHVAKLARKYLSIPASTAPAERVFSTAKNILQKKRWSLLPERLGKCIFLRHNAKLF